MARSSPARRFNSRDFPTVATPAIGRSPRPEAAPPLEGAQKRLQFRHDFIDPFAYLFGFASGTSSSSRSRWPLPVRRGAKGALAHGPDLPADPARICRRADRAASSVREAMRSASPSAWVRSIFPW